LWTLLALPTPKIGLHSTKYADLGRRLSAQANGPGDTPALTQPRPLVRFRGQRRVTTKTHWRTRQGHCGRPRKNWPAQFSLSADQRLGPASASALTNEAKTNDLRSLESKSPVGGILAPVYERGEADRCRAFFLGHLPRYGISRIFGIRTYKGRAIHRAVAFGARDASAERNVGNVARLAWNFQSVCLV
jgi:hypothetical protein